MAHRHVRRGRPAQSARPTPPTTTTTAMHGMRGRRCASRPPRRLVATSPWLKSVGAKKRSGLDRRRRTACRSCQVGQRVGLPYQLVMSTGARPKLHEFVSVDNVALSVAYSPVSEFLNFLGLVSLNLAPKRNCRLPHKQILSLFQKTSQTFKFCSKKYVIPPFGQSYGPTMDRKSIHAACDFLN